MNHHGMLKWKIQGHQDDFRKALAKNRSVYVLVSYQCYAPQSTEVTLHGETVFVGPRCLSSKFT